jgi:hypothetical protein
MARIEAPVRELKVSAYVVPTDYPESDGTLAWDKTTLVLVEAMRSSISAAKSGSRGRR